MTIRQSTQSVVTDYLSAIGKIAVLSKDQQLMHGKNIREWLDWPGGKDAAPPGVKRRGKRSLDRMVESNLRIVVSIAKKYIGNGVSMEDLIQEGNIGLMVAAEKFEPSRGYCFSTCAYWWIRQSMTRALANYSRTIRVPCNVTERIRKIRTAQLAWMQKYSSDPTPAQIAEVIGEDVEKVVHALQVFAMQPRSLDQLLCENEGSTLESFVGTNIDPTGSKQDQEALDERIDMLHELIAKLPEIEAKVVVGLVMRQDDHETIASEVGVSRYKIGQIYRSAKKRMALMAQENGWIDSDTGTTNNPAQPVITNVVSDASKLKLGRSFQRYENTLASA